MPRQMLAKSKMRSEFETDLECPSPKVYAKDIRKNAKDI